jgi:hypothetical protein
MYHVIIKDEKLNKVLVDEHCDMVAGVAGDEKNVTSFSYMRDFDGLKLLGCIAKMHEQIKRLTKLAFRD